VRVERTLAKPLRDVDPSRIAALRASGASLRAISHEMGGVGGATLYRAAPASGCANRQGSDGGLDALVCDEFLH
jgi:hypothetical protein